ncbi:MAG: hypothetical protein ACRDS0_03780 [Pseudonocardiaceae bacterium]
MVGMWIAFAFVAGMVLIGFKSRQLKWYEFIVSGIFVLLLDRLVFSGQISSWVGQIGSKAQGAAGHGALHGSMAFPFLFTPGARAKARRFTARLVKHRPTGWDYAGYLGVVIAAQLMLRWGWLVSFGVYALIMAALTGVAALFDKDQPSRTLPAHPATDTAPDSAHPEAAEDGKGVGVDG